MKQKTKAKTNIMKLVVMLMLIGILFAMFTIKVEASEEAGNTYATSDATPQTITREIELTTRSALLVDRSGSMEDREKVDEFMRQRGIIPKGYDFIGYFDDQQISVDPEYEGGGDSFICEAIDKMAERGFTHITVVTDGQQCSPNGYSALVGYTDVDLKIYLVEEAAKAEELIEELEKRLVNSRLQVLTPDGRRIVILNDYQPPVYTIEIPLPEDNDSEGDTNNIHEGDVTTDSEVAKFPWWWLLVTLLLAVLIAALFDFIHELITHRDENDGEKGATVGNDADDDESLPVIPEKGKQAIAEGDFVLADISGSMAVCQQATAMACQSVKGAAKKCLAFGDTVQHVPTAELEFMPNQGQTHGWEAVETAWNMGMKRIIIVSDMQFNGKAFQAGQMQFDRVTIIAPQGYKNHNVERLRTIAKEVEVLPLQ